MAKAERSGTAAASIQPAAPVRFVGIDIVKILACLLVVTVHFFLHSEFYATPITEEFGQAAIYGRWVAYCCVPLFMITTGYLMKNKTFSKKYYLGILRVLILYIIISLICVAFNHAFFKTSYTFWTVIKGLFMYTDAQYAWYVEYYFCIFAIIPFLNAAFASLKSRKQHLFMVAVICAITIFSQSLYLGFDPTTQSKLLPGYFTRCYPIAYYYIGAYIRQYPPKRTLENKLYILGGFCIALIFLSVSTYQQSLQNTENNNVFFSRHFNDYGTYPVAICSTLLFLLFFDITCKNQIVSGILRKISEATFSCYLLSYIFDAMFYPKLRQQYTTMPERFRAAPLAVAKTFGCAMVCALILQGLYTLCEKLICDAYHRHQAKQPVENPEG